MAEGESQIPKLLTVESNSHGSDIGVYRRSVELRVCRFSGPSSLEKAASDLAPLPDVVAVGFRPPFDGMPSGSRVFRKHPFRALLHPTGAPSLEAQPVVSAFTHYASL